MLLSYWDQKQIKTVKAILSDNNFIIIFFLFELKAELLVISNVLFFILHMY